MTLAFDRRYCHDDVLRVQMREIRLRWIHIHGNRPATPDRRFRPTQLVKSLFAQRRHVIRPRRRQPLWIPILIAVVVIAGIGAALLFKPTGTSSAVLDEGTKAYAANDRATAAMKFEQAARQHKRIEKVEEVLAGRDEMARELDQLHGV